MVSTFMMEFEADAVARGLAQGLEQGELKNQKENLEDALEDRFGEVPRTVRDFLDTAADVPLLRRLTKAAWRADSLDAFLARLEEERKT